MAMQQLSLPIIGIVQSPLKQKFGTPRQPNLVDIKSTIKMLPPYDDINAFEGIEQFSHLWIIWQFHQNRINEKREGFRATVRPPRLGGNQKIGVFATRSMYRPANLGLSVVKLLQVEQNDAGVLVHILGADMVDGTPIIDIKPYLSYSDSIEQAVSGYAAQTPSVKCVVWHPDLSDSLNTLQRTHTLTHEDLQIIERLIAQDPRPAYRQQELLTPFVMRYHTVDIAFRQVTEDTLEIHQIVALETKLKKPN